jgi:hypothetical protein
MARSGLEVVRTMTGDHAVDAAAVQVAVDLNLVFLCPPDHAVQEGEHTVVTVVIPALLLPSLLIPSLHCSLFIRNVIIVEHITGK